MDILKIVAVASSEETRSTLLQQLQEMDFVEFDGVYIELSEGVRKCQEFHPDVILVDMTGRELDASLFIGAIGMNPENPCTIFALHQEMDIDIFKDAVSKGAADFIQYPADKTALETALRKHKTLLSKVAASGASAAEDTATAGGGGEEGKLVAVFSSKGGTGGSTVAVNLAHELHFLRQEPVVFFDLDQVFCNSGVMLNLKPEFSLCDLADTNPSDVDEDLFKRIVVEHDSGLHVVVGSKSVLDDNDMISAELLEAVLDYLSTKYAFVVVDLPSHVLDPYHQYIVERANLLLMLACPDIPSLYRTRQYLDLAQNYLDMDKVKLVINRANMKGAHGISNESLEEQFRYDIYTRLADDWDLNIEANSVGNMLSKVNPKAQLVKQLQQLANLVAGDEASGEAEAGADGNSSLLGKFFKGNEKKDGKGNVVRETG